MKVDRIADDGVTLVYEVSTASQEDFRKEIFVGYDGETRVDLPNQGTLVATLTASD